MQFTSYPDHDGRPVLATIDPHRAIAELEDPQRGIALKRNTALDLVTALIEWLDDIEGDCDFEDGADHEPSIGFEINGECDLEQDSVDDEPSLGAREPGGPYVGSFGFWKVKPSWLTDAEWQDELRQRRGFAETVPTFRDVGWADGQTFDLEDEHDGAEPEDEYGGGWSEAASMLQYSLRGGGQDDDSEPSLSLTEHVNQATRIVEVSGGFWPVIDGEADYAADACFGPTNRARMADDEPSGGTPSIRTAKGVIIHEPEGIEGADGAGRQGMDSGYCDPDSLASEDFPYFGVRNGGGTGVALDLLRQHGLRVRFK